MTRRDLAWRATGLTLSLGGCAADMVHRSGSPLTLLYFLAAIIGIVLVLNGKRVATAWKAERRGHWNTAATIHERRVRRHDHTPHS